MVTSVNAHPGAWLDGVAVAGQDLRLQLASAFLTGASPSGTTGIAARPGVRYGTGNPLQVNASSGMNITVNAGTAFVQGGASATAGMYTACLDTTQTLTVATSDPTNPRIDNVIAWVTDSGNSSSTTVIALQTGTPAPSPVAPTLPTNALLLAQISVAANASSITSGNITDSRVYTVASGGILPVANTSGGITGQAGLYVHNLGSGRMQVSDGSGNARAPKTAAFTPVTVTTPSPVTVAPGVASNLASLSVTTDGATEIKIEGTIGYLAQTTPHAGDTGYVFFTLDGTNVPGGQYNWTANSGGSFMSGTYTAYATPSNGTHTITFQLLNNNTSTQSVFAGTDSSSLRNPTLRVGPSFN
jgi:hypothetical protein